MTFCFTCFRKIETLREPCPFCGAPALKRSAEPEPLTKELLLKVDNAGKPEKVREFVVNNEIHRLMKRGTECYNTGKAWLAVKNKPKARKDFERAVKYFDSVLKIDPMHQDAREYKRKSLQKIS